LLNVCSDPVWIAVTISPALVKQLRDETGAGRMNCKNALSESEGDIVKAQEFPRKFFISVRIQR